MDIPPYKTSPIEQIIPRKQESGLQNILDFFADLLDETVNFGSHIIQEDSKPPTTGEENLPPVMLLRHFIDLLDGISILIRNCCADPAKPILRSMFEAKLNLDYLFEGNTYNRAIAYVYSDLSHQIKKLKGFHPNTDRGKDLRRRLHKENLTPNFKIDFQLVESEIARLEATCASPQFSVVRNDLITQQKTKGKLPYWYEYFNGPKNIEALATLLNQKSVYDLLYRSLSSAVHGADVYQGRLSTMADGGVGITQIRHPREIQFVVRYSMTFALQVFQIYCKKRTPHFEKQQVQWYFSIRESYQEIMLKQMISIVD